MSSTFYQDAIRSFPNKVHSIVPDRIEFYNDQLVQGEEGQMVLVQPQANVTIVSADAMVAINAQTAVPANLGGAVVDFRPQEGIVQRFSHVFLRIQLTNTTGSSLTIVPAQFLLNFLQIYGANGNTLLFQTYGSNSEIFLENIWLSYDDWFVMAPLVGSTTNYSTAGVAIANGANTTMYIPVLSMLSSSHLFLQGLTDQLLIRFTFQSSAMISIAGGAATVQNMQLVCRGAYETEAVQKMKMQLYRNPPSPAIGLDFPFVATQRYNFAATLANSSTYNFVLSGLSGLTACLIIIFNALPLTSANIGSYVQVPTTYQILSQNGDDLTGYFIKSCFAASSGGTANADDNSLEYMFYTDNQMLANSNFIFISWARNIQQDVISGSSSGFCAMNSFQQLRFTTNATFAPGNFQITVIARTYETLKCRKGILSVSRV